MTTDILYAHHPKLGLTECVLKAEHEALSSHFLILWRCADRIVQAVDVLLAPSQVQAGWGSAEAFQKQAAKSSLARDKEAILQLLMERPPYDE